MRFTIVTPSLNQLDWLRLCVASVADQCADSKISVEHIVQDGGSAGIEEFARVHGATFFSGSTEVFRPRHAVGSGTRSGYSLTIYSETDDGMYDAINKGLKKATGDICAYLNCDEQYLPDTLCWVAEYFTCSPCVDVLFGAAIVTKDDGSYVCDRRVTIPSLWHTMVSGNLSIFTSSTFFRREAVVGRGLLFDPSWRVCGDAEWALRLCRSAVRMRATKRPLSAFAETGGNLSATGNPSAIGEVRRLAEFAPHVIRFCRPLVLLSYRIRRWFSGAYDLLPHSYAVYTMSGRHERTSFKVPKPTFRWQLGALRR